MKENEKEIQKRLENNMKVDKIIGFIAEEFNAFYNRTPEFKELFSSCFVGLTSNKPLNLTAHLTLSRELKNGETEPLFNIMRPFTYELIEKVHELFPYIKEYNYCFYSYGGFQFSQGKIKGQLDVVLFEIDREPKTNKSEKQWEGK